MHELGQTIAGAGVAIDNNGNGSYYTGPTIATIGGQTSRRRHSVSAGSPWTTVPPRHALHMPVMKIDPTIWRNEQHQREIHRLLHEGREEEVMKRRGIRNVMDTTTEEEEEEEGNGMSGVVLTVDFGGFKASEEREKERIRQQVREEWARLVEQQTREYQALLESAARQQAMVDSQRRNSWPWVLGQQQILFKSPTQVLHPQQQLHPQQIPSQAPAPLQQSQQQQPLMNPSAWSAAPGYAMDARRASFTMYRG
ncbi:hypothetical protein BGZ99_005088 [Dissophora globulifera]|uniref:Uncharacterized protein n=1 Tax=Dissophora globulifera TaxID=979702 RepID=A0A9P6UU67_9FUNG|nr:hypothetical protein BGZ99_005088 [Dissophora globulifera]